MSQAQRGLDKGPDQCLEGGLVAGEGLIAERKVPA
jgi:hypothetical protein